MDFSNSLLVGMQGVLHSISTVLLYPVLFLLIAGVAFAVFEIASVIVEFVRERRFFTAETPRLLRSISEAPADKMAETIAQSGLLKPQQKLLLTLYNNRDLDEESRWALSKKLLLAERERSQAKERRDVVVAKVTPMLGLMGTLIPLGPGLVAFGNGDASVMSQAMLVAFDTTVAGLVAAAVLFVISRIRHKWYAQYNSSMEAGVTSLLERMDKLSDSERKVSHPTERSAGGEARKAAATIPAEPAGALS